MFLLLSLLHTVALAIRASGLGGHVSLDYYLRFPVSTEK